MNNLFMWEARFLMGLVAKPNHHLRRGGVMITYLEWLAAIIGTMAIIGVVGYCIEQISKAWNNPWL